MASNTLETWTKRQRRDKKKLKARHRRTKKTLRQEVKKNPTLISL